MGEEDTAVDGSYVRHTGRELFNGNDTQLVDSVRPKSRHEF